MVGFDQLETVVYDAARRVDNLLGTTSKRYQVHVTSRPVQRLMERYARERRRQGKPDVPEHVAAYLRDLTNASGACKLVYHNPNLVGVLAVDRERFTQLGEAAVSHSLAAQMARDRVWEARQQGGPSFRRYQEPVPEFLVDSLAAFVRAYGFLLHGKGPEERAAAVAQAGSNRRTRGLRLDELGNAIRGEPYIEGLQFCSRLYEERGGAHLLHAVAQPFQTDGTLAITEGNIVDPSTYRPPLRVLEPAA